MLGRTPGNIVAVRPLRDGVISDYEMTEKMLDQFLKKISKFSLIKPRVIVCVPSGVTEVEERAVIQDTFDEAVAAFMRKRYGMVIGLNTAEEVKITIGCVYDRPEEVSMLVKGRDLKTGLPKEEMVSSTELMEAFKRPARQIVDEVLAVLEMSSPELVADIARNGIVLTGGGSQLYGFDFLISERTEIACTIADDPDSCVALGCGKSLEWINSMQEGTINLARRKLMKEG